MKKLAGENINMETLKQIEDKADELLKVVKDKPLKSILIIGIIYYLIKKLV